MEEKGSNLQVSGACLGCFAGVGPLVGCTFYRRDGAAGTGLSARGSVLGSHQLLPLSGHTCALDAGVHPRPVLEIRDYGCVLKANWQMAAEAREGAAIKARDFSFEQMYVLI